MTGFKSCATAGGNLAGYAQYAQYPAGYLKSGANAKLQGCGLQAETTSSCSAGNSGPSCSGFTCAETGKMQDYTWTDGKAPEGCNKCTSAPENCAQLIDMIKSEGCFGECGWALSDSSLDKFYDEFSCTASEIRDAESALSEAQEKYGDSDIAAKAGLSVVATLATAVAVLCHAI